jgi:hypothetical protein
VTAMNGPGVPVHRPVPRTDTAVTIGGPLHLRPLDTGHPSCWPAEGICSCGEVVRREAVTEPWEHTGRRPGEPG